MTDGRPEGADDRRPAPGARADRAVDPRKRPVRLHSVTVEYPRRSDRTTVAPADPSPDERTTAWLTVDSDATVGLDEVR